MPGSTSLHFEEFSMEVVMVQNIEPCKLFLILVKIVGLLKKCQLSAEITYLTQVCIQPTAIKADKYDMAVLLLSFHCKVKQEGAHCRTALHEAARLGREKMVQLLLQSGADPDPRSSFGLTPLALAAQSGHLEIVQILLRKGKMA